MNKVILFLCFVFTFSVYSQEDAWVYFNNKPNAQVFLDNPLTMLTQRALDRRNAQGIPLNINDVPIEQTYLNQVMAAPGIQVKAKSKWLNCVHIRGSVSSILALSGLEFVDRIHFADESLNARLPKPKVITSVNKQLDVQSTFAYGNSANQVQMLNVHLLHQQNFTGNGKIIAVLDSGFSEVNTILPFNRLFENSLYLGGYNYVANNSNVLSTHNHGTMTLSCMGGFVDGQLIGTAPDAKYYLFITEDISSENPVEESYWVEAAEEADRLGVDIISTSLGYFEYDNPNYSYTYSDMTGNNAFASRGANIAFSKGIVVVASAGNSGNSIEPHVGVPAEATNVLAIGAVKSDETYATFSSIGPSFDGRIKPDVMAQGQSTIVSNTSGEIIAASGTSFSCPIIAGAIASLWQAIPWATNQQIVDFVKQSADRYSNPSNQFGYGIPDFQNALDRALLSVNENNKERFIVLPNPVNDYLSISFPNSIQSVNLSIYNSLGQLVFDQIVNSNSSIYVNELSQGIYYYKIQNNFATQAGKFIKN